MSKAERLSKDLNNRTMPSPINSEIKNEKVAQTDDSQTTDNKEDNGGVNGARTRDLQRDRLAF